MSMIIPIAVIHLWIYYYDHFCILPNTLCSEREVVRSAVQHLGRFVIQEDLSERVSHVVSSEKRTLKVLEALARGCWLLSMDWVVQSFAAGHWLPESAFEQSSYFPGAKVHGSSF